MSEKDAASDERALVDRVERSYAAWQEAARNGRPDRKRLFNRYDMERRVLADHRERIASSRPAPQSTEEP